LTWLDSEYPENWQETFHTENINVVYNHPNGKWNISAYVKNISNYAEKLMYMNQTVQLGDPRTYGAVLSVKF